MAKLSPASAVAASERWQLPMLEVVARWQNSRPAPGPLAPMRVPFNHLQSLHESQRQALADAVLGVLDSGWFVLGPQVERFEVDFAAYCGTSHCVGVGNGSEALELALKAVGVVAGDSVATVANAGYYASTAILACGAMPLFVDVEDAHLQMDPQALDAVLLKRPRALVVTHLYGQLAHIECIVARCHAAGVPVIEDCAQAHGARRGGRVAGSFGDLGCYSFYPTKNLGALGDGGAVVTRDAALADRVRRLRQYGWGDKYSVALAGGRNSRLDEMQAAVLNVELPLLDARNARRRRIAALYRAGLNQLAIRPLARGGEDDVVHLYVVRCEQRDRLCQHLASRGVQAVVHFPIADHRQLALKTRYQESNLPVTETACAEVLSLPCHPALSDADVQHVIGACNDFER
ncbi:MAG: DegT/DnrJ/EryC1/StrS family aminotransferase [Pseudomarimonas sp.]